MGLKKQTLGESTEMEKEVERKYRKEFITIYFSNVFSIMKNSSFMDHIADAEQILFDKTLHCKCDTIEKAEDFVSSVRNLHLGSNIVSKVFRLGPAFMAMRNNRYKNMKNVLVIRDLPVHSSDFINNTFPTAVDICLKKKMAVVLFENEDSANLAYVTFQSMDFPPQIHPKVDRMIPKGAAASQESFDDSIVLVHNHPNKLVNDPTVVCVQLQRFFDLKSQMKLLEKLRTAEDIMLSRSCSLSFGAGVDVWERRKLLEGLDVDGERVVVWVRGRGGKRKRKEEEEQDSDEEEEEEEEVKEEEEMEEEKEVVVPTKTDKKKKKKKSSVEKPKLKERKRKPVL